MVNIARPLLRALFVLALSCRVFAQPVSVGADGVLASHHSRPGAHGNLARTRRLDARRHRPTRGAGCH